MPFQVECLHVGLDLVVIIGKRKSCVMQERASGLALGWGRSFRGVWDWAGRGVIDLGVPFFPWTYLWTSTSSLFLLAF